MYQIDDINASATPAAPPTTDIGSPGWFQGGVPATGQVATRVRFWWLNCVQGALLGLLQAGGVATSKTDFSVVRQAVSNIGRRQWRYAANGTFGVPDGVTRIRVRLWGGGGPGGNGNSGAGGGGAGGGYCEGYLVVTPGETLNISIGAAGIAGASAGGTSGISRAGTTLLSATGGGGGGLGPTGPGSTSFGIGLGDAYSFAPLGQSGQNGISVASLSIGGQGGNVFGFTGGAAQMIASGGNAAGNGGQTGAGGGGGTGTGQGGNGGPGYVLVEF